MKKALPLLGCPAEDSWRRLLEEVVSSTERDELEFHLCRCGICRDAFVVLASDTGSLDGSFPLGGELLGRSTAAMLARIVRSNPLGDRSQDWPSPDSGVPVVDDQVIPSIPGFADLVEIGRGGMGVVYRARQLDLNRTVAIKLIPAASTFDRSSRARAVREALTMARLRHPNIVSVHGSGEVNGAPYLVMEWVDGGTLQQRLNRSTFSFRGAAALVRELAGAVAEAHAMGIVHRDLKPSNVLLPEDGNAASCVGAKLTDFGLARCWGEDQGVTETGLVLGTPSYMAPEQTGLARSCGEVGPATDVHALGAILHALLVGRPPYPADSTWEILLNVARGEPEPLRHGRPGVPRDLETIVAKCLAREPSRRYHSALGLADDLGRFLEGRPVLARPVSLPVRLGKWAARRPALASSLALIALLLVSGLGGASYHVWQLRRALSNLEIEQRKLGEEKGRSDAASRLAERARDRSRRALETLTGDAIQAMVDRGPVLNDRDLAFLRKVQGYYHELDRDERGVESEESLRFRALGLLKVGSLFERISRRDDARLAMEAGISLIDELLRRRPSEPDLAAWRLEASGRLADSLQANGDHAGALALIRSSLESAAGIAWRSTDQALRQEKTRGRLASTLAGQGRLEEAEGAYALALAAIRELRSRAPLDLAIRTMEFGCVYNRGLNLRNLSRFDEAETAFREALGLAEAGRRDDPVSVSFAHWKILAFDRLVDVAIATYRPADALAVQLQEAEAVRDLARLSPDPHQLSGIRLSTAHSLYEILTRLKRGGEAEASLREAIDDGMREIAESPARFDFYMPVIDCLNALATVFEDLGRSEEALQTHDRLEKLAGSWMSSAPHRERLAIRLTETLEDSARIHLARKNPAEAARRYERARAIASESDRPRLALGLAEALRDLGDLEGARLAASTAAANPILTDDARRLLGAIDEQGRVAWVSP
jgi:tetratricopeptide (TPR) repeat protein